MLRRSSHWLTMLIAFNLFCDTGNAKFARCMLCGCVAPFTCRSQRKALYSCSLLSIFLWVSGAGFRLSGLSTKHSYPMSYLTGTDLIVLDPFSVTFPLKCKQSFGASENSEKFLGLGDVSRKPGTLVLLVAGLSSSFSSDIQVQSAHDCLPGTYLSRSGWSSAFTGKQCAQITGARSVRSANPALLC